MNQGRDGHDLVQLEHHAAVVAGSTVALDGEYGGIEVGEGVRTHSEN